MSLVGDRRQSVVSPLDLKEGREGKGGSGVRWTRQAEKNKTRRREEEEETMLRD